MNEQKIELNKLINTENLSNDDVFPNISNDKTYQTLLSRFAKSQEAMSDEFVVSEALKIYSKLDENDFELKIRILELLKGSIF